MGDLRFADGVVFQHLVPGPIAIGALAERLGVTQQAASKAVADLERRGYVERAAGAADGRVRHVSLTARGPGGDRGRPPPPRRAAGGARGQARARARRGRPAAARRRGRGARRGRRRARAPRAPAALRSHRAYLYNALGAAIGWRPPRPWGGFLEATYLVCRGRDGRRTRTRGAGRRRRRGSHGVVGRSVLPADGQRRLRRRPLRARRSTTHRDGQPPRRQRA